MIFSSSSRDFFYIDSQTSALTYYIAVDGEPVYWGKAVSPNGIKINVGKRISDYLDTHMPDFREYDGVVVEHPRQLRVFNLYDGDSNLLDSYTVLLDFDGSWTGGYGVLAAPINSHVDPRQKIFWASVWNESKDITVETARELDIVFDVDVPIFIGASGGTYDIHYTANTEFTFSYDGGGWFTASTENGVIHIVADENENDARYGSICFTYIGRGFVEKTQCFTVSQESSVPYFIVDSAFTIFGWEEDVSVTGRTNVSGITITIDGDWLTNSGYSVDLGSKTAVINLSAELGDLFEERTATVYVWYDGEVLASFSVTQSQIDFGGAILGISDIPDTYYYTTEERANLDYLISPKVYNGILFYGLVFSAETPYDVTSGYVSTNNGIISHIGSLASSDDLYVSGITTGAMDETKASLFDENRYGGGYHTLIFPKNLKSIPDSGFTIPVTRQCVVYDEGSSPIHKNSHCVDGELMVRRIYWNTTLGIPANFFEYEVDNVGQSIENFPNLELFSSSATSIGSKAFFRAFKYGKPFNIVGLENATSIGSSAFTGCELASSVTLNSSGVRIGANAFCQATVPFTRIDNAVFNGTRVFSQARFTGGSLFLNNVVLGGSDFSYQSGITSFVTSGVSAIPDSCFFNSGYSAYLVSAVTDASTIGVSAFLHNVGLKYLDCPNVKTIGTDAFKYCENISYVNFPKLESGTLTRTKITRLDLPSIKSIQSFSGNTLLSEVYIGSGLTTIGDEAFSGCTSLEYIHYDGTMDDFNNNVNITGYWWSHSPIKGVICTDGTLTWCCINNGIRDVLTVISPSPESAVTLSRNNFITSEINIANSFPNLYSMTLDAETSATTRLRATSGSTIRELNVSGNKINITCSGSPYYAVDVTFTLKGSNATLTITNMYGFYMNSLRIMKYDSATTISKIEIDGNALGYNVLTEIIFDGTKQEWNNVRTLSQNWNNPYPRVEKIVCTDGEIIV